MWYIYLDITSDNSYKSPYVYYYRWLMNLINYLLYSHLQEHLSLTKDGVSTHIY